MKINSLTGTAFHTVSIILLHKKFRSWETKSVYALLYIPYHEHIISAFTHPWHTRQDRFLHQITVLILIHHHFGKPLLIFFSNRRWHDFPLCISRQDCQCKLLHITEINHISPPLFFIKPVSKLLYQSGQRPHCLSGILHICNPFICRCIEIRFLNPINQSFQLLPDSLDGFPQLRIDSLIFFTRKLFPVEIHQNLTHFLIRVCPFQLFQFFFIWFQCLCIHIRTCRELTDFHRLSNQSIQIAQLLSDTFFHCMHHSWIFQMLSVYFIIFCTGDQPLTWIRITSWVFIQLKNQFLNLFIRSACSIFFHKFPELFLIFCIMFFQHFIQYILFKQT